LLITTLQFDGALTDVSFRRVATEAGFLAAKKSGNLTTVNPVALYRMDNIAAAPGGLRP
jgi:hypothetical protein